MLLSPLFCGEVTVTRNSILNQLVSVKYIIPYLKREGSAHPLWINPKSGVIEAVPRHTEVKEQLAKKILRKSRCRIDPSSSKSVEITVLHAISYAWY